MRLYDQAPEGSTSRARCLRRRSTDAERKLWRALREKLPETKWRRQTPVGPYIVDFLCFAAKLIVELDGGQHAEAIQYDAQRTAFLPAYRHRLECALRINPRLGLRELDRLVPPPSLPR